MKVIDTSIPDVKILEPTVFGDDRGFFMEIWNARTFAGFGIDPKFVQDNHSKSAKGILRGLHFQMRQPQGKLVRVVVGAAYDVAVDLRRHSPTFKKWVGVEISATNKRMVWVPIGFAHGFLSLMEGTEFLYKCTDFYAPEDEVSLLWNDPTIGVTWPLQDIGAPQLAAKDAAGLPFEAIQVFP